MKMRRGPKRALYGVLLALFLTGSSVFALSRWVRVPGAFGEEHHPLEAWITRSHTAMAYLALVALGYLVQAHIQPGLRAGKSRASGLGVLATWSVLALTSLGVLYASEGLLRDAARAVHSYLGLSLPMLLAVHLRGKLKTRSRSASALLVDRMPALPDPTGPNGGRHTA